ncbi:hypothetical protein AB0D04_04670 [Streptomyces sp. NPDC048483]|uniref:hypothetical protein n=1 Tax=Streptomyces sp. NPDC048483 TaxID=3154927 RepID=UPI003432905E
MTLFACAGCDAVLSAPLSQVALPAHAHQKWGNGVLLPVLMEPGTYAVDPEPSGLPWRPWSEVGEEEAAAHGVFAPVYGLCFGPPGAIVIAPGDTRGTVLIPERCDGYCCGLDGSDGPNLACAQCGRAVATRIDDCSLWQAVWFAPHAVAHLPADEPAGQSVGWEALAQERQGTPPVDPSGAWSMQWEAAVGAGLAHLLAASAGAPVDVPDGLVAVTFGPALDALIPSGTRARTVALAGPGLPDPDPAPDILLVPQHPRTGEAWQPPGDTRTVPLAAEVWTYLAFHRERLLVPATGGLPDGVLRDDPLPMHPRGLFQPDRQVFLETLARLPAVRQPWLRRIYDRMKGPPYPLPF